MEKENISREDFLRLSSAGCMGAVFSAGVGTKALSPANYPTYVSSWNNSEVLSELNLFDDMNIWKRWAPRQIQAPHFKKETASGVKKPPCLKIKGSSNLGECGCWMRPLPTLKAGKRYHIKVNFTIQDVENPGKSIWAITTTESNKGSNLYMELNYRGMEEGKHVMGLDIAPKETLDSLALRLYLAWSKQGIVQWKSARFYKLVDNSLPSHIIKSAAISGTPANPKSTEECIDFYSKRLDEVGKTGVDIVCLPELINAARVPGSYWENAEPITGPSFHRLAEKANQYSMYLTASLAERRNGLLHNTAVLIDKVGELVGKYEKTHPTISEGLLSGTVPGDQYPVFHTDIGKIGLMICYDNHFPEVARILAAKGADIIMFPNWGDGREDGTMWQPYLRTRAMDNQVHIVTAANVLGQTGIFTPRAELVDQAEQKRGAIATADCDLNSTVKNSTKRPIGKRYLQIRRPRTYNPLNKPLFNLDPYSRVRLE